MSRERAISEVVDGDDTADNGAKALEQFGSRAVRIHDGRVGAGLGDRGAHERVVPGPAE